MTVALRVEREWTAEEFVVADQRRFGDAWRYELVDGRIIAHDAPEPDHGAILAGLIGALASRAAQLPLGCRPEVGSAAVPRYQRRNTARIPDVVIRCGEHPVVSFEVVSPSEIRDWRARDRKRRDVQAVQGVREIVEIYQSDFAVQIYRLLPGGAWGFNSVEGLEAVVRLDSIGIELPLAEIYRFANPPADQAEASGA